jgi:hypothetical protein
MFRLPLPLIIPLQQSSKELSLFCYLAPNKSAACLIPLQTFTHTEEPTNRALRFYQNKQGSPKMSRKRYSFSERLVVYNNHIRPAPARKDLPDESPSAYKSGDNTDMPYGLAYKLHAPALDTGFRPFLSHATQEFGNVARGDPLPYTLDSAERAAAGLTEDTWTLSITADKSIDPPHVKIPAEIEKELSLDLAALKELGRMYGTVKVVKVSCEVPKRCNSQSM